MDKELKDICPELEKRYELKFLEIGTDEDHVHFLVQSKQLNMLKILMFVTIGIGLAIGLYLK